jgi:protein phosphatase 2C-like protein
MSGSWKYAAASVIGTSHLKSVSGICQDAHRCEYVTDIERLICVVSDGAGSASRAERGSQLACDLVVKLASVAPSEVIHTREFALEALDAIRSALSEEAHQEDLRLRDFACTLLVAVVSGNQTSFWQIGDGAICFRFRTEEQYRFVFWPAKGEFANVTEFVTDDRAAEELEFDTMEGSPADLALFSDGLERVALDFGAGEAHTPFFSGFFPHLYSQPAGHLVEIEQKLNEFLGSERINSKTDDDKTLILATVESR